MDKSLDLKISISDILAIVAIVVSIFSVRYTYKTAHYAKEANIIAEQQTIIADQQKKIAQQQTDILDRQTDIQNESLQFQIDKNWTDTAKEYRETINHLYGKIYEDPNYNAIYAKIKKNEEVQIIENLDRFVSDFEDIGALYCDGKIKLADLRTILKSTIEPVCGNSQIFHHYQDTKSWLAALCYTLFPRSSVMATYANPDKCPILKN